MRNYLRETFLEILKGILLAIVVLLMLSGICLSAERPTVNVPPEWRKGNWKSPHGYGSCVHASFITLLRWQGRYETAAMWERTYSGGDWYNAFEKKLEAKGIRYASTAEKGDVSFLEWACRTRRGANVTVRGGMHMVTLVHLDEEWVAIIDNNATKNFIWIPRDRFIAEWKASYSWAVTPVYKPAAPAPE